MFLKRVKFLQDKYTKFYIRTDEVSLCPRLILCCFFLVRKCLLQVYPFMAALMHKLLLYISVKVVVPCMNFTCPSLVTDDGECSPHFSGPSYSNVF